MTKNQFVCLFASASMMFSFSACGNNSEPEREIQLMQDSTSFDNNPDTDIAPANEPELTVAPESSTPASAGAAPAAKRTNKPAPVINQTRPAETAAQTPEVATEPAPAEVTETAKEEPEVAEKKGMSKTAKGAIIGGAAGAVGGAIISKKKGVGAVVGAATGAAAGAIIGKQQDKKDKAKQEAKDGKEAEQ